MQADTDNKYRSLEYALKSNAGNTYDQEGRAIVDVKLIISAAKEIETYLKGENKNV